MCSVFTDDKQVTLVCNTEKDRHVHLNLRTAGNSYMYVYTQSYPPYKNKDLQNRQSNGLLT